MTKENGPVEWEDADRDEETRARLRELAVRLHGGETAYVHFEHGEQVPVPSVLRRGLAQLVGNLLEADFVRIEALSSQLTTQEAADYIGVSRPTLIKLLGDGEDQIPFVLAAPGQSHRRIRLIDLVAFIERRAAVASQRGKPLLLEGRKALLGKGSSRLPPKPGSQPVASSKAADTRIGVRINGKHFESDVEPRLLLVYYLRDVLGLTGTHVGCDTSQCGACTILVDGEAVKSCTMFAVQAHGKSITTIEGMSRNGQLHPIQQAFWDEHGLQCGYCTPGFIMAAAYLLAQNPNPTDQEIRVGLEGNLCRCTGYVNIIESVKSAARMMGSVSMAVPKGTGAGSSR